MTPAPPSLAVWLLESRLPAEWCDFVVGDLEEEFHSRAERSPSAARWWYWRQAIRCLAAPPAHRSSSMHSVSQGDSVMRTLVADVRYGCRVLARTPSFTLAVVAVLALGIGANTAIFSIVNAVLLRPLPLDDPERIVRIFHVPPQDTFPGITRFSVSPANFYDWKRDARSFEGMAIYRFRQFTLTGGGDVKAVIAGAVGADFFELLGVQPALGRIFRPEEDAPDKSRVVIVSDGFWKSRFGGAGDVIGRPLVLDGEAYTIVGVMPARFSLMSWAISARDIWVPVAYTTAERAVRENHNAQVVARLKPGVDLSQAESEMDVISSRLAREYPQEAGGWSATVISLQELIVGDIRLLLVILLAAVGLVLLIACANVANLLFARALGRRKELAIRAALGAGRGRVFQQLLVESLLLSGLGGLAGLLLARFSLSAGAVLLADRLPRAEEVTIDGHVLLFAIAGSVLTGLLAGALPAFRAGLTNPNETLKEGGRSDAGAVGLRTRRVLIVCEVALSVVLLAGAGVMIRSLSALRSVDGGFDPQNVMTMTVTLSPKRYPANEQRTAFFDRVLERLRALPGVQAAGAIDDLPLQGGGSQQPIVITGRPELSPRDQPSVAVRKLTPGYLRAMNVQLVKGRDLVAGDKDVMLMSQAAAKMLFGEDDPIGKHAILPLQSKMVVKEIVGVVGDIKDAGLAEAPGPTVYEYSRDRDWASLSLVLRSSVPPTSLTQPAVQAVHDIDPEEPVIDIRPMTQIVDNTLRSQQFSAQLLGLFAGLALTLASVGIYSVLSYVVRGRSREISIRTALGAKTSDVLRLVVVEGMTPAIIGVMAGLVGALAAGRILTGVVYGVSVTDPLTLTVVAGTLTLTALLASLVPAVRASRQDPLKALR